MRILKLRLVLKLALMFALKRAQQIVGRESRCIGMFRIMTGPARLE
jgi:hypothetical protein